MHLRKLCLASQLGSVQFAQVLMNLVVRQLENNRHFVEVKYHNRFLSLWFSAIGTREFARRTFSCLTTNKIPTKYATYVENFNMHDLLRNILARMYYPRNQSKLLTDYKLPKVAERKGHNTQWDLRAFKMWRPLRAQLHCINCELQMM